VEIERRLAELGLTLPAAPPPLGNYAWAVRTGSLLFLATHGPFEPGTHTPRYRGKLGRDLDVDTGYAAARLTVLHQLVTIRTELGDLDRVARCVRMTSYVNAVEGLADYYRASDGATDLLCALYGERGRPARASIVVLDLPGGVPIALDLVVEVAAE
jgi:enamine deaminase RidA (YjgF/YER057c/UK114 family)